MPGPERPACEVLDEVEEVGVKHDAGEGRGNEALAGEHGGFAISANEDTADNLPKVS